jgi:DNA-binding NarL/FixJ family response regulator
MTVILIAVDLAVISRVQGAAARAGTTLRAVAGDAAADACAAERAPLVIIDLTVAALDVATLIPHLKRLASPPRIIAFGPHVHEDKLSAARQAGCDAVISRGEFFASVDRILSKMN